jgi:putative GTP pyrophosphokinase
MALKNQRKTTTPEEWKNVYEENHAIFQEFTDKLQKLIHELLQKHKIDAQIEHRTKSIESSLVKIQKKGYRNPLEELTDLVGIRIIAYYKEDVDKIGEIIIREFDVDWEKSIDKAQILDPDRFGYLSVHYVISLSSHRKELTEWKAFANIKAEIQVRTNLQHAWAKISHKFIYKTAEEAPKNLRRQLFRLSALLELADEEFSNVTKLIEEAKEHNSQDLKKGKLDIELDLTSLDVYLDFTKQHLKWMKIAEEVGYESPEDMLDTSELREIYFNQLKSDKRKLLKFYI